MAFPKFTILKKGKSAREALRFLGEHAFWATVLLMALSALIAALLYYQYVVSLPRNAGTRTFEFEFREELFQNTLEGLDREQQRLKEVDFLVPRDVFNP